MQQQGSKYFARSPHPPPLKRSNSTFAEHGRVAYQIKEITYAATL